MVVDSSRPLDVLAALQDALAGGPAVLPHPGSPDGVPDTVEQRVAVAIETSGSTGRPKRVALGADALLASAAAAEGQLGGAQATGAGQWLLAVPAHYIAGVNVLVRSIAAQTEPAIMAPGSFTAERFVEAAAELGAPRRYTSLVPAQLTRLIESDAALDTLRRFDRILVGGQAVPVALAARALELGLNVTRTYGSSETSGGCVWDGLPIGDTELRTVDGRVQIAGSVLAYGYLGDPARTADAFLDEGGRRWYRTDDTGTITDGVLAISGRVDDVIVSGGVKISLAEIERVVRTVEGLEDAVVVAAPHPAWGETPVVVGTMDVALDVIRAAVSSELGGAAAPTRMIVVEAIPHTPNGKPDRPSIAALALK